MRAILKSACYNMGAWGFSQRSLSGQLDAYIRILQGANKVDSKEWRYLLAGGGSSETQSIPNPAPEWLTDQTWGETRLSFSLGLHATHGTFFPVWMPTFLFLYLLFNEQFLAPSRWQFKYQSNSKNTVHSC